MHIGNSWALAIALTVVFATGLVRGDDSSYKPTITKLTDAQVADVKAGRAFAQDKLFPPPLQSGAAKDADTLFQNSGSFITNSSLYKIGADYQAYDLFLRGFNAAGQAMRTGQDAADLRAYQDLLVVLWKRLQAEFLKSGLSYEAFSACTPDNASQLKELIEKNPFPPDTDQPASAPSAPVTNAAPDLPVLPPLSPPTHP